MTIESGTVRYHRADYHPKRRDYPWTVWFVPNGEDYDFTAAEGEAMGLTPPEPAPLVVTCGAHSIELSNKEVAAVIEQCAALAVGSVFERFARLLRDARQDPQPASDEPTYFPDEGFNLVKRNVRTVTANVVQPAALSPLDHLRALLGDRDDADELIAHAASAWIGTGLRGAVGDAARGGA